MIILLSNLQEIVENIEIETNLNNLVLIKKILHATGIQTFLIHMRRGSDLLYQNENYPSLGNGIY